MSNGMNSPIHRSPRRSRLLIISCSCFPKLTATISQGPVHPRGETDTEAVVLLFQRRHRLESILVFIVVAVVAVLSPTRPPPRASYLPPFEQASICAPEPLPREPFQPKRNKELISYNFDIGGFDNGS